MSPKSHLHQIRLDLPKIREEAQQEVRGILTPHFGPGMVPPHMASHLVEIVLKKAGIVCTEPDCDRAMRAKGYCGKHHRQHFRKTAKEEGVQ